MWTLDNTSLPTDGETRTEEDSLGLSLFVTDLPRTNEDPVFYTADPQDIYNKDTKQGFETVVSEDSPVPTTSKFYVFSGFVEVDGAEEASSLYYLDNNRFFYDYIDKISYYVVDSATTTFSGSYEEDYDYLDFDIDISTSVDPVLTLDLNSTNLVFSDIEEIDVEGRVYSKSATSPPPIEQFFWDSTSRLLTVQASQVCGPVDGDTITVKYLLDETTYDEVLDVFRFDLSTLELDYVDYISHQNIAYYPSSEITTNTLIYNRIDKVALCLS